MASITQKIPSYTSGISQQPDELKSPGQLKEAKNVFPDVTHGLMKRPGGRLIGSALTAYNTNSKWFHYYRDENEQYIGQIQRSDGELKMWRCSDGAAMTVNSYSNALKTYLTHTADEDLQTLTLNDYTYVTNRTKTTAMAAATADRPHEAYISLQKVAYASQYAVNIFNDTSTTTATTATRINITLERSSNNYCDGNGSMAIRSNRGESGYTNRCDGDAGQSSDEFAPNVGTKIFSITDGLAETDEGAIADDGTYTIDVKNSSNQSVNRGKNLYFRVATISQAVANTVPQGDVPYDYHVTHYNSRYTTTYDLLYGGEEWQEGHYLYFWMKEGKYK